MLLARRFTLNPVLVIISRFWMWGNSGRDPLRAMLAITKIICDRVRPLAAFGHFLEGEARCGLRGNVLLEQLPRTSVCGRTSRRRR